MTTIHSIDILLFERNPCQSSALLPWIPNFNPIDKLGIAGEEGRHCGDETPGDLHRALPALLLHNIQLCLRVLDGLEHVDPLRRLLHNPPAVTNIPSPSE